MVLLNLPVAKKGAPNGSFKCAGGKKKRGHQMVLLNLPVANQNLTVKKSKVSTFLKVDLIDNQGENTREAHQMDLLNLPDANSNLTMKRRKKIVTIFLKVNLTDNQGENKKRDTKWFF